MIDFVRVVYGFPVGKVTFHQLIDGVSLVAKVNSVDFDLLLANNRVTITVHPFKHSNAKEISEINGAEIMRSLISLCDKFIDHGVLWSADMASPLPF